MISLIGISGESLPLMRSCAITDRPLRYIVDNQHDSLRVWPDIARMTDGPAVLLRTHDR
jgi:hypothetical protein